MSSGTKSIENLTRYVKELRERLSDVIASNKKYDDDLYLIQWLKRHSFKVDRTEAMIREALKWWKENDIESLVHTDVSTDFSVLSQEFPVTIDSKGDSYGVPVITFNGNRRDFVTIVKKHGKETMCRYLYYFGVQAEQQILKQIASIRKECDNVGLENTVKNEFVTRDGRILYIGIIIIASFQDISLWVAKSTTILSLMLDAAKVGSNYFPVFVNQVFFINANKVLETIFKIMKPLIASPYYPVECFDQNRDKWSAVLLKHIDSNRLTPEFGGTKSISVK